MIPLLLLLTLGLLIVLLATIAQLSSMLLHPPRMTDGKALYHLRRVSPSDLGLPFEPCAFQVRDDRDGRRLKIAAWWIPADSQTADRTCILIHGYGDAKVGGIAWAPLLHELGWHVLAIDLRAHGESDGDACTGGDRESADLAQVIAQLRAARADQTRSLVLYGISLGGAVALGAAARDDVEVDGVITDSTFSDFLAAACTHARLIGAPGRSLHAFAVRLGLWRVGADLSTLAPIDSVLRCDCPVLAIHPADDPFVPPKQREAMARSLARRNNPRDEHLIIPGAGHCLGMVADPAGYQAHVAAFLERVVKPDEPSLRTREDEVVRDR